MTEYAKLVLAEASCHTMELFYGADDGSDDKVVSADEFSRDFEITAMISA